MWSTTLVNGAVVASNGYAAVTDLSSHLVQAGVGVLGGTLVRTHLLLSVSCLNTDTNPGVFFGVTVFDVTAATPGTPAVDTEFDIDWMYQSFISPGTSPSAVTFAASTLYGANLDLKSRRRLHEVHDRPLFFLHNNGSANTTYSLWVKALFALP